MCGDRLGGRSPLFYGARLRNLPRPPCPSSPERIRVRCFAGRFPVCRMWASLSGVRFRRRNGCAEARSAVSAVNGCGFPPQRPLPGCGYFLPAARSDARTAGRSLPGRRISRKFCCEQSSICRNFLTFVRTNKQRRYGKNQRNNRCRQGALQGVRGLCFGLSVRRARAVGGGQQQRLSRCVDGQSRFLHGLCLLCGDLSG